MTGKDSIEALLNNNTVLTKTDVKLSAVIKAQAAEIKSLTAGGGGRRNRGNGGLLEMEPRQISPPDWRNGVPIASGTPGMTRMTVLS